MLLKDLIFIINPFEYVCVIHRDYDAIEYYGTDDYDVEFADPWHKIHGSILNEEVIDIRVVHMNYRDCICIEVKRNVSDSTKDVIS